MTRNASATRPKRTRVSTRNVINVTGKDPAYHYRIVSDTPGRVQLFQENGWELCEAKDHTLYDARAGAATPEGTKAQMVLGKTDGLKGYLMRIKREWYEEDQAAKQADHDELMNSIRKQASTNADYGKLEISK